MYREVFASRVKKAREENKLSQIEAAKLLGVKQPTIAMYENGKREPNLEMLGKIATSYYHSVDYFLGLSDD